MVAGSVQPALAQSSELKGTVTDESGAIIVGATATLDDGHGHKRTARSDEAGHYRFAPVAAGTYTLTVSAKDFDQSSEQISMPSPPPELEA